MAKSSTSVEKSRKKKTKKRVGHKHPEAEVAPRREANRLRWNTLRAENLVLEWSMSGGELSATEWMRRKGLTPSQIAQTYLAIKPADWLVKRKEMGDKITGTILKGHVDFVADMNDTHIKSAKLGLAKAIDFMSRMKLEEKRDKHGKSYFVGFKPSDLLKCMESIKIAQSIQRKALGLPGDEGSITAWQTVQHNRSEKTVIAINGDVRSETTETLTVEEGAKTLEASLSYDDIRLLIESERRRKAAVTESAVKVIDVNV